ncbi:MAG: DUF805 domain-containing protein [Oscillospiraceae bacterium]|nr:DUF805 domain-containing protein [Oscillospiraceae bacterium]
MEKLLEFKPFKALMKMIGECMDFKGRTASGEYWWAVLGIVIVLFAVRLVAILLLVVSPLKFLDKIIVWLYELAYLAGAFLFLSMSVRRLHDVNKPWPWLLLCLTVFGGLVPLYFCTQKSHPEENQYGPVPTSIV